MKFDILFSETYLGHFTPMAGLALPFFLHCYWIWGIAPQTLPVSEELSEIQCSNFESKEQLAPQQTEGNVARIWPFLYGLLQETGSMPPGQAGICKRFLPRHHVILSFQSKTSLFLESLFHGI